VDRLAPQHETGLCDAVRAAAEKGTSFEIVGHGTKRKLGRRTSASAILDMGAFAGIAKYEPEELVMTVGAATSIAEIETELAGRNQMLGFEPADWGPLFGEPASEATIAGTAAANSCGSRRVKAGAVRDHVIGCRFVNGNGEAIKAGGNVIKNVTGFDVARLMCGAFGTLGAITELSLRVVPRPARVAALCIACSAEEGLKILRAAAQSQVDPTGLAYMPAPEGRALIRVEGEAEPVRDKLDVLKKQFAAHRTRALDGDESNQLFRDLSDGAPLRDANSDLWRLCVTPSRAYEAITESGASNWYADWAGGLLWLALPADEAAADRLRAITGKYGGHATLLRAGEDARHKLDVFDPESPVRAGLTRAVKNAFDPKCVFNPSRMYKDI
jgi:glycolate oxidase FAD binding subunit